MLLVLLVAVAEEYDDYLTKQFFGRMVIHTTRRRKPWQAMAMAFWRIIMHLCERCSMVMVLLLSCVSYFALVFRPC